MLLINFFLWRATDFLIIYLSPFFVIYLGFFPYKELLKDFNMPYFLTKLANFDGIHYLLIAKNGYSQFEQAFFPLYPIIIRIFNFLINNYLLTGILISNISFFFGLYFLKKAFNNDNLILFLLAFPTSFYFGAVYTEGLFFLFFSLVLYFLKKERFFLASVFGFLASLTRLVGIFLIVPILFSLILKIKNLKFKIGYVIRYTLYVTLPFFGLFLYCFYLWKTTGDPLMFLNAQPAFGANRSNHLIFLPQVIWRYIKIFFTADISFQYFVSLFEFLIFIYIFIVLLFDIKNLILIKNLKLKIKNYYLFSLNLFSFLNLILPTLTGTLSSMPRYSLFSISFFLYLSNIKNKFIKNFLFIIFIIFHILSLAFFSQGYFIS
ncbi:MAG: hypothetical protein Fur009_0080 [Candidatus Microgenomates bacterium]